MHHYHLRWDEIEQLPYGLFERLVAELPPEGVTGVDPRREDQA